MLIIVSDIHLADGTCGKSISASAFHLFVDRLQDLAFNASWRPDGTYQPIKEINLLMLGDILDPLHSTLWLEKGPGEPGCVRPWTDSGDPDFAVKLKTITRNILQNNAEALGILKGVSGEAGLSLPPATRSGIPDLDARQREPVSVRLHYMVGNHDWYYHLLGADFTAIRQEIIQAIGLSNPPTPFPHELSESEEIWNLLDRYKVFAQHGDLKEDMPPGVLDSLHDLVNVRPVLATALWIGSQLRQNFIGQEVQEKIKSLWNEVYSEFLALTFVREENKPYKLDMVDGLDLAIRLTDRLPFKTIDEIVVWSRRKFNADEITFSRYALKEEAFLDRVARFIVYGHTHHHEIVPLDSFPGTTGPTNQIYINSGTWHTYFDLATHKLAEQKFISYQVLTYLTFYQDDERRGNCFETWSGTFSD